MYVGVYLCIRMKFCVCGKKPFCHRVYLSIVRQLCNYIVELIYAL